MTAFDPHDLPDLIERLHSRQQWEKVGHNHDLLEEALKAIEALRERVAQLNDWLNKHESMLAKSRSQLNNARRGLKNDEARTENKP